MFDKFIESGSESDQNSRRGYFLVSTVIVGVLFVTGVIASIYAQEVGLGTDEFELSSMLAPIVPEAPEPSQPDRQQQQQAEQPDRIIRQANILRIEEHPIAPTTTSVVQNTQATRPDAPFDIGLSDTPAFTSISPGDPSGTVGTSVPGTSSRLEEPEVAEDRTTPPEPPSAVRKVPRVISKGPVGGLAIYLPKPPYPKPAQMIGAAGDVVVQVLIDENGNVVSAKAVNGHPLLRHEAERAARRAKFHPTKLGDVPVKVTGVITYKFSK